MIKEPTVGSPEKYQRCAVITGVAYLKCPGSKGVKIHSIYAYSVSGTEMHRK